jgi:phenylacetate-CoA ligase
MRNEIEESLNTRVVDSYGSQEINLLAWECPKTGLYHTEDDSLVLEVVRNGKPVAEGESGEVVITGLHSRVFPLIRYSLGDVAVRGPASCPCGAPFSTLERIQGRTIEYYYRSDGSPVQHWALADPLNSTLGKLVGRYQIVQERDGSILYRLMPLGEISRAQIDQLQRIGSEILGVGTPFEIRIEKEIPCAPSGKMLQSVNRLHSLGGRSLWDPAEVDWTWGG